MRERLYPLLILELMILYSANSFIQAYLQYILNVTKYESFLLLLIPIGLCVLFGIFIQRKAIRLYWDKMELGFHIFIIFSAYSLSIFHFSNPILPHESYIKVPFILWLGYSFFLGGGCIISIANSQNSPMNIIDIRINLTNSIIFLSIILITVNILRFFNNPITYFSISSGIHLLYVTLLLLKPKYKENNKDEGQNLGSIEQIASTRYLDHFGKILEFVFILACFIIGWYQNGFLFKENMTFGIEGRISSIISVWNSGFLILGSIIGIIMNSILLTKFHKNFSTHIFILFVLSLCSILLNPTFALILLGYLIAIIITNLNSTNSILIALTLWLLVIINLGGYYVLFDFPIFSGLLGSGIESDLNLFRIIIIILFFSTISFEMIILKSNRLKTEKRK